MKRRNSRQDAIREIVRVQTIRTQRGLVHELQAMGYVLAEDLHLQRMLSEFVVCVLRAENLVVIKCQPGTASGVAAAVDDAGLAHALGSVAGNDTVLVVADTTENAKSLQNLIQKLGNAE